MVIPAWSGILVLFFVVKLERDKSINTGKWYCDISGVGGKASAPTRDIVPEYRHIQCRETNRYEL